MRTYEDGFEALMVRFGVKSEVLGNIRYSTG